MNDEQIEELDAQAEPEAETPKLKIIECFGMILLLVILQFLASLLLTRTRNPALGETGWPNLALSHLISGLLTAKAGTILAGFTFGALVLPLRVNLKNLILVIVGVLGLSILSSELSNVLQAIEPISQSYLDLFNSLFQQNLAGVVMAIGIIAPVTEELIFRGVMLEGLQARYPVKTAFFASTILFAAVHVLPWLMINAFLIGCFLAWLKLKTQSLALCMIAHSLYNSLPFVLTRATSLQITGYTTEAGPQIQFQPLWFDGLGVLLLAGGIAGISYLTRAAYVKSPE